MTRDELLKTFNRRFYIWLPNLEEHNLYETHVVSDAHEAIARALEYFALYDIEHPKRDTMHVVYAVSVSMSGPWVSLPIGPAWRLSSPIVQDIVERSLLMKDGPWILRLLTDGDVETFEAAMDRAGLP